MQGDFKCTSRNALLLVLLGVLGGFGLGAFGIGIGVFFLPALIQIDVHPIVAQQTAHFIATVAGFSASIVVVILKRINLEYAGLSVLFTVVGSLLGIYYQQRISTLSRGRTHYGILVLFIVLVLLLLAIPPISIMLLSYRHK